jgi:NADH dehydrogenase
VDTLYNTYWVRFDHGDHTFESAVANTRILIRAAREAGVKRIVHVSITNPSPDSPLPYFRGKALLERSVRESGLAYAILRPTVIFGAEDILINNIAWLLRRFPVFAIPGSGSYRLQPIFVEDMAELAVRAGAALDNQVIDAVGPDIFTFNELLDLVAHSLGSHTMHVHLPAEMALALSRVIGALTGDVVLTRDEIAGLSAGLLVSSAAPTGWTRLADWLAQNRSSVGMRYASELRRHYHA